MDTNQRAAVAIPPQPRDGTGETVASTRRARFQIRLDPARRGESVSPFGTCMCTLIGTVS